MKIFFILPLFNESAGIQLLLKKIRCVCEEQNYSYHIVAVDDGSTDSTPAILQDWAQKILLSIVSHRINRGLGESVRDGFEVAAELSSPGDVIVRLDGDNSHEPDYVPSMLAKIEEGYDVVIASRFQAGGGMKGISRYRAFISRSANLFMKLLFPIRGVRDFSCGFRAYRASLVKEAIDLFGNLFIDLKGLGFTCTVEKLVKFRMLGARMTEVPFVLRYDQKMSDSKMITNITTLGYLVLALKSIYPWGRHGKLLRQEAKKNSQASTT